MGSSEGQKEEVELKLEFQKAETQKMQKTAEDNLEIDEEVKKAQIIKIIRRKDKTIVTANKGFSQGT